MSAPDTKTRILDAAEKLFASHGIEGSGLRLITRKAGVNLAAINYHFGSKENLVRAILSRFILTLDQERDRRLEQAETRAVNSRERLEDVVRAFMMPWVSFRKERPQYVRIIARIYSRRNRPNGLFRDIMHDGSREAYTTFTRAVFETLPEIPREVLRKRINLAVATAASFLLNAWLIEGLEELSGLKIDEELLLDHVVNLIESGLPGENKRKQVKNSRTG